MKSLKLIIAFIAAIACANTVSAQALSQAEQLAQKALYTALADKDYSPLINTDRQSVDFTKGGQTYWINIKGKTSPLLYTINISGYSFKTDKADLTAQERGQLALLAASKLNATTNIKVVMDNNNTVRFTYPMYAKNVEDVVDALPAVLKEFKDVKDNFGKLYNAEEKEYKDTRAAVQKIEDRVLVVEQPYEPTIGPANGPLVVNGVGIRVVSAAGAVISPFNQPITKENCAFIEESINLTAEKAGNRTIGVKIYNPEGKLMLPTPDAAYTTVTTIEIKKAKKPADYILKKFGYSTAGEWLQGKYEIEFYEDGNCFYTAQFQIL